MNTAELTVVVLARDEAARLPAVFASLPPEARIFVLDAESRDDTVAVARAHGAQVETRRWGGFVDARRYALGRVQTRWTLMLDADELLDARARAALASARDDVAGYALRRVTTLCGTAIRTAGWSNEMLLRLFRTDRARVEPNSVGGGADLHERWVVDGPIGVLPGTIVHASYPTLASYRAKFARNVCGLSEAMTSEVDETTPDPVIDFIPEQRNLDLKGGTMRLGAYDCALEDGSLAARAYGQTQINERHRHR
ncbi:MAG TPA: glycosyltransferase, partial [Candidatus Acidoferrum sp.]|nr:glycosyltransferase [Candidatus Acidoferrum sp.]